MTPTVAHVVVDLSRLAFCDLAGQRVLLRGHQAGAALIGAQPCVRRLFELTRVHGVS